MCLVSLPLCVSCKAQLSRHNKHFKTYSLTIEFMLILTPTYSSCGLAFFVFVTGFHSFTNGYKRKKDFENCLYFVLAHRVLHQKPPLITLAAARLHWAPFVCTDNMNFFSKAVVKCEEVQIKRLKIENVRLQMKGGLPCVFLCFPAAWWVVSKCLQTTLHRPWPWQPETKAISRRFSAQHRVILSDQFHTSFCQQPPTPTHQPRLSGEGNTVRVDLRKECISIHIFATARKKKEAWELFHGIYRFQIIIF